MKISSLILLVIGTALSLSAHAQTVYDPNMVINCVVCVTSEMQWDSDNRTCVTTEGLLLQSTFQECVNRYYLTAIKNVIETV